MGLRSFINRVVERHLRRKRDRLEAEAEAHLARLVAEGKPITMTDEEHAKLNAAAERAGPAAQERFRKLARLAGRT